MQWNELFKGLFDNDLVRVVSLWDFLLCLGVSLVIGLIFAVCYMLRSRYSKSFVITLSLLPTIVCVVIMMVNGNVGTGVAVAGAFSLVRFRSIPGSAMEIAMLFLAMASGLIAGMGYLGYALLFSLILGAIFVIYQLCGLGAGKRAAAYRVVNVTVPEDLDYTDLFDDIFTEYTRSCELVRVKTVNLGSMIRLTYRVVIKDASREKEMIDCLRTRNGNLEISVSKQESGSMEL